MIPKSLFENIRRIEITTNRLVTDVFAGQYKSTFKGRGMEFDEVREYMPGDDVRAIDWNVTARMGTAFIKKYVEERELTLMIMVDVSPSCHFGMVREFKSRLAAEMAAVLSFAAIRNNDKIGLIIFTDGIEKYIPPRKGRLHVLRIIREVLYFKATGKGTNITGALEFLNKVIIRRSVAFLISDFIEDKKLDKDEPSFLKPMAIAARRHDLIAVSLNDPREQELPACGTVSFVDAETKQVAVIDTMSSAARRAYRERAIVRRAARERMFRSMKVDHVEIWTHEPFADKLARFFDMRRRKR